MSLRIKLVITFLLIAIIPMGLVGTLNFINSKEALRQSTLSGLNTMAEFREGTVFLYIEKLNARTIDFSSDGFIADSLEKINNRLPEAPAVTKALNAHLIRNKKTLHKGILAIDILNLQGIIVSSTDPSRIGIDKSSKTYFKQGLQKLYATDLHQEPDGTVEIDIAAPIRTRRHPAKTIGVLVNHHNNVELNKIMTGDLFIELGALTQLRGMGKTGETYLVNRDRLMITDSLFIPEAIFRQTVDTYPVRKCLEENEEVTGIWPDYRGVPVAGASMCISIENFRWVLLSEQDTSEAFAPIATLRDIFMGIAILIVLLVTLIALSIAKVISRPIQNLTTAAREISGGDFSARVTPTKRKDELGILSTAFTQMTVKLQAVMKSLEHEKKNLEHAVDERTAHLKKANRATLNIMEDLKKERELAIQLKEKSAASAEETHILNRELLIVKENLERKMESLEQFHKIVVGRELKMTEMKERIAELEAKLKEK